MDRVVPQLAMQVVERPEDSPFFKRFQQYPDAIPPAERERLTAAARKVIAESVIPAYRRFASAFGHEYLPACRDTVGIWDTPDGRALYANRARYHTTTTLTPEQIHEIGLAEVARNRAEMQQVMDQVGFKGSLTEFFEFLRTDPQFYYQTGDELFRAYAYITKVIDPELPRLFGKLYRTPFGLRAIPDTSAPNTTTAYYSGPSVDGTRPGYYYVNLYRPEVRPKYEMEVLTVHEAAPGHHLQIALAQEQGELPKFRRFGGFTAYIEGWALYSERLGYDLGLYKDPYSRFGQLTYDQWRAVRLVVDTGIHHMGWTRQQAIDYFLANAAKTEADIVNEIDRYIAWPGQALAYKIGQLRILELRDRATQALGDKFDIRAFHDTVLATGAVPLDILERTVDDWIRSRQQP
jgi:prolyl oligopeptidase